MTNAKTLLKKIIPVGISKVLGILAYFLTIPLLIEYLNLEEYGLWLTVSSVTSWLLLFDIGVGLGIKNVVTKLTVNNNILLLRQYVSTSYIFLLVIMLIFTTIFYIINFFFFDLSSIYNTPIHLKKAVFICNNILISSVFLLLVQKNIIFILQGLQKTGLAEFINATSILLILLVIWISNNFNLSFGGNRLVTVSIIYSIIPLFTYFTFSFILFNTTEKAIRPTMNFFEFKLIGDISGFGIHFFVIQLTGLIMFSTDSIIISHIFDNVSVSIYNIAFRYFGLINIGFGITLIPIWPMVAKYFHEKKYDEIENVKNNLLKLFFTFSIIAVVMLLLSNTIYTLWIDNKLKIPFELSVSMLIYVIVICWGSIFGTLLNAMGKTSFQMKYSLIIMLINVPLCIFFSKYLNLGLIGIPIGTIVCLCIGNTLITLHYVKQINKLKL